MPNARACALLCALLLAAAPVARGARPSTAAHRLDDAAAPSGAPTARGSESGGGGDAGWTSWLPSWPLAPFRGWNPFGPHDAGACENSDIRKFGLKALREMPFIGLFENLRNVSKFEASGMTMAKGSLWVVFDNLHSIGRVDEHFQFRDPINVLLGHLGKDSQFEGLSYDEVDDRFYAIEEVVEQEDTHLHPVVQEIAINDRTKTYDIVERCPVEFELTHANKGFEGIHYWRDAKDRSREFLLGLCEGNWCEGGRRGREAGNGRVVVASFWKNDTGCGWEVVKVVEIPRTAKFIDYSGIAFRGDRVGITSQENSALWIGHFDFEELEFVRNEEAQVYHFPRDNHCEMIYCNVEGITWLDDSRIIFSSDKAKSTQPYRCTAHDQSIGIFALPN
ncbi:MAG: hypothetical protein J3K34DRAFT_428254 [Monoraphidium minutum]|nr:MAG: hypothetical protein J3K34DRAFT_428254 [Monoraphidium minutum]